MDNDIRLLADVLYYKFTAPDLQELKRRCFLSNLEEMPELENLWNHYLPNERPRNSSNEDLDWALQKLQRRGKLENFLQIVCEVRPDLAGELVEPRFGHFIASAPPPPSLSDWWLETLLSIGLFAGVSSFLLFHWRVSAELLIVGQMTLFTTAICIVPNVVNSLVKQRGRFARMTLEIVLFVALLLGFGLWLFGRSLFSPWVVYAVAMILLLEAGGHLVEQYKVTTLKRLSRSVSFENIQSDAESAEKMFRSEVVLYVSVPLGMTVGTAVGLIRGQTAGATITICLQIVLFLASLILLVFLVNAFVQMKDPLFKTAQVSSLKITSEWVKKRKGFTDIIVQVFRFLVPPLKPEKSDQEQEYLDLACMVTDLRKIYLYDAVHNVSLLVAFVTIVVKVLGIASDMKLLFVILMGLSLLFNQLPYVLGQSALHAKLLEPYEGINRVKLAEKLRKYAPLLPTSDFLASLLATGTAGSMLYFLLDNFIKETLK